jgi:hypothetical protein
MSASEAAYEVADQVHDVVDEAEQGNASPVADAQDLGTAARENEEQSDAAAKPSATKRTRKRTAKRTQTAGQGAKTESTSGAKAKVPAKPRSKAAAKPTPKTIAKPTPKTVAQADPQNPQDADASAEAGKTADDQSVA